MPGVGLEADPAGLAAKGLFDRIPTFYSRRYSQPAEVIRAGDFKANQYRTHIRIAPSALGTRLTLAPLCPALLQRTARSAAAAQPCQLASPDSPEAARL